LEVLLHIRNFHGPTTHHNIIIQIQQQLARDFRPLPLDPEFTQSLLQRRVNPLCLRVSHEELIEFGRADPPPNLHHERQEAFLCQGQTRKLGFAISNPHKSLIFFLKFFSDDFQRVLIFKNKPLII
jgi:hypothetical protein